MAADTSPTMTEYFLERSQRALEFAKYAFQGAYYPECCQNAHLSAELSIKALRFHSGDRHSEIIRSHNIPRLYEVLLQRLPKLRLLLDMARHIDVFEEYSEYVEYIDQTKVPPVRPSDRYLREDAEEAVKAATAILEAAEKVVQTVEAIVRETTIPDTR